MARTAKPFDRSGRSNHHLAIRPEPVTMSDATDGRSSCRRASVLPASRPSMAPPFWLSSMPHVMVPYEAVVEV